ncbi:MAG: hypothetical protein JWQ38_1625 [Flavipsychrobacter sp.]|nr:hypothetical protein [Flavipsychrobacter sp.]
MKKMSALLVVVMAFLLIFSGCKKKETKPSYYIRATVGTTDYDVSECIALSSGNTTIIKGANATATSTYSYIGLSLQKTSLLPGDTIRFVKSPASFANVYYTSGSSSVSHTGTVIITEMTGNSLSGTFIFTCTDGTTVTGGIFNAERK